MTSKRSPTTAKLKKLQGAKDFPEDLLSIPSLDLTDLKQEITEYPIAVNEDEAGLAVTVI